LPLLLLLPLLAKLCALGFLFVEEGACCFCDNDEEEVGSSTGTARSP